ncbi:gluconokinase [Georgenia muralis]|uniref:Gluconokinase n=1 Tax=Georgenia muralis TaxID=154117 RepID=A0A3N4Z5R7_9MICO|nr:gluconokinase [Georgenia muralis]
MRGPAVTATTSIGLAEAIDPLVVALDVGSTGTRGGVYDATGRPVRGLRHKVPHAFTTRPDGTSEIDPAQVLREVADILDALDDSRLGARVRGVALDTFAASLVGVDAAGTAVTACLTYADSRSAAHAAALREELDVRAVHDRTGTMIHPSYHAPRLRWLAATAPDVARSSSWWSLGEYVYFHLLGTTAVGTSTAAWTGLLDRRTGAWDTELLEATRTSPERFSPVHDPGAPLTPATGAVARRWPTLAGAVWFPVVSDGFASNVGAGAVDATSIAAAAATSGALRVLLDAPPEKVPDGLWSYRVDAGRSLLGGALNDVGRAVTWLSETLRIDGTRGAVLLAEPSATTPLVLPYLSGERAPGWAGDARAVLTGVGAATTPDDLYRGTLEGVALTYARVADRLAPAAPRADRIMASGRVAKDLPEWLQILADVLGRPVTHVTARRSTLRGTALIALDVLAPGVARSSPETGATYEPVAGRSGYYADRGARFAALYDALVRG